MSWTNADRIKNGSMPDKTFVQCTEFIKRAAVYIFVLHSPDPGNSVSAESEENMKKDIGQMLSIIESLIFEDMTIYEVSQHLGMDTDTVYEKIQESRRILLRYV